MCFYLSAGAVAIATVDEIVSVNQSAHSLPWEQVLTSSGPSGIVCQRSQRNEILPNTCNMQLFYRL